MIIFLFTVQACSHCAFDGDDCIGDDTKECREGVRQGKDWYELIKVRPDIFQNPEWDVDFEVAKT